MEVIQYLTTTLTTVFGKFLPWISLAALVYVISFKLPFLFLVKVQREQKKADEAPELTKSNVSQLDIKKLQEKVKLEQAANNERIEAKAEEIKSKKKEERKSGEKKSEPKKPSAPRLTLAEEIFELNPGETFKKSQLKKKYHDLLRKNHPDKVDSLGKDFKVLAEKKTKDINKAYQELKSKAS